jgi:hypothetical protein
MQVTTIDDLRISGLDPAAVAQVLYRGVSIDWDLLSQYFPNLVGAHCLLIDVVCHGTVPEIETDCVCSDEVEMLIPAVTGTDAAELMMMIPTSPVTVAAPTTTIIVPPPQLVDASVTSTQRSFLTGILHELQHAMPTATSPHSLNPGECPAVYSQGVTKFLAAIPSKECLMMFFGGEGNFAGLVIGALSLTVAYLYSGYALSWGTIRIILSVSLKKKS